MNSKGQIKISFLSTSFPRFDGDFSGNFVFHFAQELSHQGASLEIIAPDDPASRPISENFNIVRFPYFFPRSWQKLAYGAGITSQKSVWVWLQLPFFLTNFFLNALKSARKSQLIHAFWSASGIIALTVRCFKPRPVIITLWGSDKRIAEIPILSKLILFILVTADAIVCEENSLKSFLVSRGLDPEKIYLIKNGIDKNLFQPRDSTVTKRNLGLKENQQIILSIGSLNKTKNHSLLIDAFDEIAESNPSWNLFIIGEGEERANLESQIQRSENVQKIKLLGLKKHDSISQWLNAADIFVLPSKSEGTPNALLEAMASGLPVVASRVGGVPELIKNKIEGMLFDPNSKDDLKEKLNALVHDKDLRNSLGMHATEKINSEFGSWKQQTDKLLSIYNRLLSPPTN
ncbi:MAG: glycosyltransferase [Nitrospinae bacterium]|nr:glycosyltransferase [Nitrospinota bacterium]